MGLYAKETKTASKRKRKKNFSFIFISFVLIFFSPICMCVEVAGEWMDGSQSPAMKRAFISSLILLSFRCRSVSVLSLIPIFFSSCSYAMFIIVYSNIIITDYTPKIKCIQKMKTNTSQKKRTENTLLKFIHSFQFEQN